MSPYKMMEEIVCYCGKCKLDLNHRITRVEKGLPVRVHCLTCRTDRSYHGKSTSQGTKRKGAQEAEWREKLLRRDRVPKPYDIEQAYAMDDHLRHKLFGTGVVVGFIHPDKVNVYFEDGLKTLKCGKL